MPELDLGNVKGPQGKSAYQSALDAGYSGSEEAFNTAMAKAPDAVLYTAQSLSDTQKAQARENIAAAVAGGGVMERATEIIAASKDETYESFCQKVDAVLATMPDNCVKFVFSYPPEWYGDGYDMAALYKASNDYASLKSIGSYALTKPNGFMMMKSAGAWKPLEYIDPPMELGVEYRTTERYLGKPVYVKVVDCGACPANGYKDIVYGTTGIVLPIRCEGTWSYGSRSTIPFESSNEDQLHIGALGGAIRIKTGGKDFSGFTCAATVWYTKTTD